MWEWICGNGIAEIGREKKRVAIDLWQWHCWNRRKKKLLQLVCGNGIVEIEERDIKKGCIFLFFQYFFWLKQFGLSCSFMVKVPYETDKDRFKYNEYIDSYSKVHAVNKNKKKYIDSYRRKKWLMCKQKTKKVYRFLQ